MLMMEDTRSTMTFQCDELSTTMFQKLYEQKRTSRFCDITLYVNNKIIKAHRNVLASSSPYFDSILKHHKIIREQLNISCLDSEIFGIILDFMYTGEITIGHSTVEELLKLADHFILTKVIEYCIEFLGTKLNLENCLFTYFLTQRFKLKHLGNIVENWIASHVEEICKGDEILGLSTLEIVEFLRNKNFILSTGKTLYIIAQWVLMDIEKREKDFEKLIKCLPTTNLEPGEVFKHLETCMLYIKSELCLYKFLDYLPRNNWTFTNFKTRYDVLQAKYGQLPINDKIELDVKQEKIVITEKCISNSSSSGSSSSTSSSSSENSFSSIMVRAKLKNRRQMILKRLMLFGLKPSLRMAALKMLTCKKKRISLSEDNENETEVDDPDEKVGIKCPICFTTINDSLLLEQHLALSHAKDVTYKCGICTFVCQYHGDYLNHMKTHFSGPPFKCDYCNFNTEQISKLISHRAQHLDESIYQCTFCSFKCRLKQNFIAHMKLHTPEKPFKCDQCSKAFRFKQNLDTHIATHHHQQQQQQQLSHVPEKNLSCDSCGFHTKFLSHMIAHKRMHTGDVYRCSYPHCKYSTSKKSQLSSHAKSHNNNGVRPHSCAICGRGFMEKSHLVRHERIHLEEKPFKCSSCDYASSRRDKLKEHFTRHHGENASAKVPYKARPLRNAGGGGGGGGAAAGSGSAGGNNGNTSSGGSGGRPKSQGTQETSTPTTSASNNSTNNVNFTQTNNNGSTNSTPASQSMGSEIQDLIMHHHQNHSAASAVNSNNNNNPNYPPTVIPPSPHHFGDPSDFHHHLHHHNHQHNHAAAAAAHNLHNQLLSSSSSGAAAQRSSTNQHHQNNTNNNNNSLVVNHHHHVLAAAAASRGNAAAAAAAVASTATSTAAAVAAAMMLDPRFHHNSTVPYHPSSTPVSMAMAAVQSSQQIQSSGQPSDYPSSLQNCMTLF